MPAKRHFSDSEKLAHLEQLIVDLRRWRDQPDSMWHETYHAIKNIAADYQQKLSGPRSSTLMALENLVAGARKSKHQIGYLDFNHMQAVAEGFLAHWSAVRAALEKAS